MKSFLCDFCLLLLVSFPVLNLQIGHHHPHLHLVPPERMLFHTSLLFLRLPSFCLGACLSLSSHLHLSKSSLLRLSSHPPTDVLAFLQCCSGAMLLEPKNGVLFSSVQPLSNTVPDTWNACNKS